MKLTDDIWKSLPDAWRGSLAAQLADGETLVGWFQPDLDCALQFQTGFVALTDRRLLAAAGHTDRQPDPGAIPAAFRSNEGNGHARGNIALNTDSNGKAIAWQSWLLTPEMELRTSEHGGVGTFELVTPTQRLAHWRYTQSHCAYARNLETRLSTMRLSRADSGAIEPLSTVCPSCGEVITSDDGVCAACARLAPLPPVSSLYRLLQFAKPRAGMLLFGLGLTIAGSMSALVPPYITMPLVNNVLVPLQEGRGANVQLVYFYLSAMFGFAILAWLLNWARLYVTSWVSERIVSDLRSRTYAHLQKLSLEFFGGKRTGDLMSRIDTDTDRICVFLSVSLVDFVNDAVTIAITVVVLLTINPLLALCTLTTFPIIVWMVYVVKQRLRHGFNQSAVATGQLSSVLADTIPGIRVVKAFAQESRETERFDRANRHLLQVNTRLNVVWSFFGPLVSLLTEFGLLGVWAFGVWLAFHNGLTVGVLTAFVAYIRGFYGRLETMIRIVYSTQRAAASAHRIFEILDRVPSVPEPVKPVNPGRIRGDIELRGVRFKYGAREVLHGIDLKIEAGEMIGLVGPTGAGKSTLINLICRFFDVAQGAILADGVDIRSYPVQEYRRNIGIVLQDPFLFYGTIAENIAYGRPNATRAEIVAAARAARAHEFILHLPDGYDSLVGERGQSLSGGERQRVSIARALLIDPRILILDEATSSVDTQTEREIQIALDNLIQGRTTIAIAHRLSTLRKADRLVVVDRGRIAQIGKHAELLHDQAGAYARLHQAQMELTHGIGA